MMDQLFQPEEERQLCTITGIQYRDNGRQEKEDKLLLTVGTVSSRQYSSSPTEFSDESVSSDATLRPQALEEKCRLPSRWPWRLSSPSSIGALGITFWHLSKVDSAMAKS
ncbi:hypothetical protein LUU34_00545500 [Aix galericulata]|nr:hypothetical protein LUU34_00545500 [Aix galericulata]